MQTEAEQKGSVEALHVGRCDQPKLQAELSLLPKPSSHQFIAKQKEVLTDKESRTAV